MLRQLGIQYEGRLRERPVRGGVRNISWCKSGLQASYDPHNVYRWSMQQFQQVATIWSRFSVPDPSGGGLEGKKVGEIPNLAVSWNCWKSRLFYHPALLPRGQGSRIDSRLLPLAGTAVYSMGIHCGGHGRPANPICTKIYSASPPDMPFS